MMNQFMKHMLYVKCVDKILEKERQHLIKLVYIVQNLDILIILLKYKLVLNIMML